ncbi:MAG: hypothetical protein PVF49_13460 [Anaerolineales bacterium]
MNVLHITDPTFTDRHWQSYYTLLEALHDRYESPIAKTGWERTKKTFLSLAHSDPNYRRFVALDGDTAIGWADFKLYAPGTDQQSVMVRFEPLSDQVPEELEHCVAAEFLRLLDKYGVTSAHLTATTERIAVVARHWRGRVLNRLDRFRLYRSRAETRRMRSWLERIPRENPDLQMAFFAPVPEEHLVPYTELLVTCLKEMPTEQESEDRYQITVDEIRRDNTWRRKNGLNVYTYALFGPNGKMVGHSNASINEADPSDVYQAMTGVDREYRGRGLSRWLKAALFFKVGEDFPANETMTTDMRAVNAPIQKVNAEMGYVLLHSGHEFDLTADGLRQFLG